MSITSPDVPKRPQDVPPYVPKCGRDVPAGWGWCAAWQPTSPHLSSRAPPPGTLMTAPRTATVRRAPRRQRGCWPPRRSRTCWASRGLSCTPSRGVAAFPRSVSANGMSAFDRTRSPTGSSTRSGRRDGGRNEPPSINRRVGSAASGSGEPGPSPCPQGRGRNHLHLDRCAHPHRTSRVRRGVLLAGAALQSPACLCGGLGGGVGMIAVTTAAVTRAITFGDARGRLVGAGGGAYFGVDRRGGWCVSPAEHGVLLLGPPRSGKTSGVIVPSVLAHNRAGGVDVNQAATCCRRPAGRRSEHGRVWEFDPTGRGSYARGSGRCGGRR